jgi:hypothetical protein
MQLAANVTPGDDLDWYAIEWKRSYRIVKNLRQRIFRASRDAPLGVRKLLEPWCGVTRSPGSAGRGW